MSHEIVYPFGLKKKVQKNTIKEEQNEHNSFETFSVHKMKRMKILSSINFLMDYQFKSHEFNLLSPYEFFRKFAKYQFLTIDYWYNINCSIM